jgi:hypothetical protein
LDLMARKIKGSFCERTPAPKSAFDKRSFRWKKSGRAWVLVGCPKGRWRKNRCAVGTKAHKVLAPAKGRSKRGAQTRCRVGRKIKKG